MWNSAWRACSALESPKHCHRVQNVSGGPRGPCPQLGCTEGSPLTQEEASTSALTPEDTCPPTYPCPSGACRAHLCLGGEAGSGEGSSSGWGWEGEKGSCSFLLVTPLRPAHPVHFHSLKHMGAHQQWCRNSCPGPPVVSAPSGNIWDRVGQENKGGKSISGNRAVSVCCPGRASWRVSSRRWLRAGSRGGPPRAGLGNCWRDPQWDLGGQCQDLYPQA